MPLMATPETLTNSTIRSAPTVQRALHRAIAEVKGLPGVRWKGGDANKEAVVNAFWLWMGDQRPEVLAAILEAYLPRFEAILSGEEWPAIPPSESRSEPTDAPIPKRRTRGAG